MKYKLTKKEYKLLKKRHAKMYKKSKDLALERMDNLKDGDPRENEGYILSEKLLYQSEEERLKLKEILDEKEYLEITDNGKIQQGVHVEISLNNGNKDYLIVSPLLADPNEGMISTESLLGEALIGLEEGDQFEYSVGDRSFKGEVIEIKFEES